MTETKWEKIDEDLAHITFRLRVPGGWLYRHSFKNAPNIPDTMVFVPFPWDMTAAQSKQWVAGEEPEGSNPDDLSCS